MDTEIFFVTFGHLWGMAVSAVPHVPCASIHAVRPHHPASWLQADTCFGKENGVEVECLRLLPLGSYQARSQISALLHLDIKHMRNHGY